MKIARRLSVNFWSSRLIGVLLAVFGIVFGSGEGRSASQDAPNPTAIAQTDEGFQTQFNAIVRAGCAGEMETEAQLAEQMRLPDAATWFRNNFDAAEASKLTLRYEQLLADYAGSEEKTIRNVCETEGAEIGVSHANSPEGTRIAPGYKLSATRPFGSARYVRRTTESGASRVCRRDWRLHRVFIRDVSGGELSFFPRAAHSRRTSRSGLHRGWFGHRLSAGVDLGGDGVRQRRLCRRGRGNRVRRRSG